MRDSQSRVHPQESVESELLPLVPFAEPNRSIVLSVPSSSRMTRGFVFLGRCDAARGKRPRRTREQRVQRVEARSVVELDASRQRSSPLTHLEYRAIQECLEQHCFLGDEGIHGRKEEPDQVETRERKKSEKRNVQLTVEVHELNLPRSYKRR